MRQALLGLVLACALQWSRAAVAQVPSPTAPRTTQALRVEEAPVVDGSLEDPAWQLATFTGDLLQKEPQQGAPATQRTEVALVYDGQALYIGARLYCDSPETLEAVLTRRDEAGSAERFLVSLDTYRDRRTAYSFAVTAAGVRVDWFHPEDNETRRDSSFNPIWEARTRLTPYGWAAELRIPFSQLRFTAAEEQVWGLNLHRYVPRRNEEDYWVVVPRDVTAWASWFGELRGIRGVEPSSRIELLPYAAGDLRLDMQGEPGAGTPLAGSPPYSGRIGLDAKMGLGPNLTLDATLNPDFGQVELDPAQINLTAFEPFFEERRPFFTEGSPMLVAPSGPVYFYSRRIGAAPRLEAVADDVEQPRATPLLGAAKLTGRLPSGLSLGVLGALTGEAYARTYDSAAGEVGRVKLEPLTGWGVLRAQQELGPSGSVVGASFTTVRRDNARGEGLTAELPREAYTGSMDWSLRLNEGEYVLSGYVGGSHLRGSPQAMLRLQQSSARFFQRPDQDYARLDPEASELSGYTLGLRAVRQSGAHWLWNTSLTLESPGFELNDAGRLLSADDIDLNLGLRYRETRPGPLLRAWEVGVTAFSSWNYGGVRQLSVLSLNTALTLPDFWSTRLSVSYVPRALSDSLTRGGPLMETGQGVEVNASLGSNPADTTRWDIGGMAWAYEQGSAGATVSAALTVQVGDNLRLSAEPMAWLYTEVPQYVATLGGGRPELYGQRYVFAAVSRRELALRLRVNLFLTPDLSLEAYAEPFASSGVYSSFGELERAGSRLLRRYGEAEGTSLSRLGEGNLEVRDGGQSFTLEDPDFNVRSFRSNLALRWEWRLGSTLYFVWQQDRYQGTARGNALSPLALGSALVAPGSHILAVKLAWWLPVD